MKLSEYLMLLKQVDQAAVAHGQAAQDLVLRILQSRVHLSNTWQQWDYAIQLAHEEEAKQPAAVSIPIVQTASCRGCHVVIHPDCPAHGEKSSAAIVELADPASLPLIEELAQRARTLQQDIHRSHGHDADVADFLSAFKIVVAHRQKEDSRGKSGIPAKAE